MFTHVHHVETITFMTHYRPILLPLSVFTLLTAGLPLNFHVAFFFL